MQQHSRAEESIRAQSIRLLYSQSTAAVVVSIGVALLTAYYFWHGQSSGYVTAWVAVVSVVSLFRLFLFRLFSSRAPSDSELGVWLRWHIVGSFLGGAAWGLLSLLYDPGWGTGQQVVLFVVIAGLATAAISSYAAALVSYAAFLIPLLLPLLFKLFAIDSPDSNHLWLIIVVFGAGLFAVARNFHSHVVNTIHLVVEQESLQEAVRTGTKQLQNTECALHTTELRLEQVLESSLDGFWDWDIIHEQIYFSPRYKRQLGFNDDELRNEFSSWESRLHPEDRDSILSKVQVYLESPWGYWEEEFRLRHKDGSYKWILARAVPTLDDKNKPTRLTGVHIDITERIKSERKIKFLAYHDPLTRLPNRILLNDRLELALARANRASAQVFILFIDLDQFKHVNDSLGHPVGDSVLQSVAARLLEQVRKSDTLARLSGDEFAVLLEDLHEPGDAVVVAQKILDCLAQPFVEESHAFNLGASIGISAFPGDGADAATLLKNADAAMYRAKKTGRNRFEFYSEEFTNAAFQHIKLEYGLRQALLQNQFQVYYQPKLCLKTGRVLGAEALLRWLHPDEGFISPQEFIPVAEESGLIMDIGAWVLRQACDDAVSWKRQGLLFEHVAVNISGVQVEHAQFVHSVSSILASSGLPPEYLELEVTESFLMKDAEASAALLADLRGLGIGIAIDDFGTGYSSLAYLTRFPVHKLKIDRSFIGNIFSDEQNAEISRAIINLGHSLNMKVVAEGIELEQQLAFLEGEGCDEGQGYLIARPLPQDDFVEFLKRHANEGRVPGFLVGM